MPSGARALPWGKSLSASVRWNYTTFLNLAFLALVLIVRFVRTGGPAMLRMMGGGPEETGRHPQAGHADH